MSYNNLKRFIREQAIKGQDPEQLREGLILNGWERKDVDKAINEVYGLKKKIKKTAITIIILLVIIFSLSLLLIFGDLYFNDKDEEPTENERPTPPPTEPETEDSCTAINNITLKEDCYLEEIQRGFNCENLNEEETFYCNRVLEIYLLDALE